MSRSAAAFFAALVLCMGTEAHAADDSSKHFKIKARPLADALMEFGVQSGLTVVAPSTLTAGKKASAVRGELAPTEALGRLLKGSGLTFARAADGTIAIQAVASNGPVQASAGESDFDKDLTQPSELQEVVVTARRRSEDLQSVPISITAFSSDELTQRHITNQVDLANNTPSLVAIQSGYPGEYGAFVVRGQGPAYNATSGTETYFAETPDPYLGMEGRPGSFYDLANVQILKGPQGTLFGKNSTGGNVLFEPQRPTNGFGGYMEGQLGDYNERQIDGAINLPIIDEKILLRLAGTAEWRDGYTTDVGPYFPGRDYDNIAYQGFRIGLLVKPIDGLESYSLYRYQASDDNGAGTVPYANESTVPARIAAFAAQSDRDVRHVSYDLLEFDKAYYSQFLNQTSYWFNDDLQVKNIASFTRNYLAYAYDYDASPIPVAGQSSSTLPTQGFHYVSEEMQLQGKPLNDALQYTIGIFGDNLHTPGYEGFNYILGPSRSVLIDQLTTDRSHAGFAQGTYDFGKLSPVLTGLSATAGYRYTTEYTSSASVIPIVHSQTVGAASFHYGSYTFDIDYNLARDTMVYVSLRDAFKAGGFNTTVAASSGYASYPPEKLVNKEFGIKSTNRLWGMETRVDIAAFFGDYDNIQRQALVTAINGAGLTIPAQVVQSAAQGRIDGVEFEGTIIPLAGLEITLNYAYTDAAYTKILPTAIGISQGTPFPMLPENKGSLTAAYTFPISAAYGKVTLFEDVTYQSKQSVASTSQTLYPWLPGYGLLNLRLDWDHMFGRSIGAALFVTNATDKTFATGQLDFSAANGFVTRTYGAPRMYGVQLRYSFGKPR
jgi:iron complex outermembrane recepter protein